MKLIFREGAHYVLRFDKGEDVIEELARFAEAEKISGASFGGIGATEGVTLAYYNLDEKKYYDKDFNDRLEIVSLTGNIARLEGKPIVHAHGSFSDPDMQVMAGHVKRLMVSATCEVFLTALNGEIMREYSEEIGLNLLK